MNLWVVEISKINKVVVLAETKEDAEDIASMQADDALDDRELHARGLFFAHPSQPLDAPESTLVYHEQNGEIPLWRARELASEALREAQAHKEFLRRQLDMFQKSA